MKKNSLRVRLYKNGIIIYSETLPHIGCYTYYEYGNKKVKIVNRVKESGFIIDLFLDYAFAYIMIFVCNIILFQLEVKNMEIILMQFAIPAMVTAIRLIAKIIYYVANDINKEYVAISKVLNIYEKKHHIPNMRELQKAIPFRTTKNEIVCNISLFILEIFYCIIMSKIYSNSLSINIYFSVVLFTLAVILSKTKFVNAIVSPLQWVILSKPGLDELKLAIKALENYERMEKKLKAHSI